MELLRINSTENFHYFLFGQVSIKSFFAVSLRRQPQLQLHQSQQHCILRQSVLQVVLCEKLKKI